MGGKGRSDDDDIYVFICVLLFFAFFFKLFFGVFRCFWADAEFHLLAHLEGEERIDVRREPDAPDNHLPSRFVRYKISGGDSFSYEAWFALIPSALRVVGPSKQQS